MSKKKTTAPEKQYIGFDDYNEVIIWIGTLKDVAEAVETYVHVQELTLDEVESNVHIYELGPKKGMEIYPGKLEIVVTP